MGCVVSKETLDNLFFYNYFKNQKLYKNTSVKAIFCKVPLLTKNSEFYLGKIVCRNKDLFYCSGPYKLVNSKLNSKLNKLLTGLNTLAIAHSKVYAKNFTITLKHEITDLDSEDINDWIKTPVYTPLFHVFNGTKAESIEQSPVFDLYFRLMYKDLKDKLSNINPKVGFHHPTKLINFDIDESSYAINFFTSAKITEETADLFVGSTKSVYNRMIGFSFGFNIIDSNFNILERHIIGGNELRHGKPIFNLSPLTINKRILAAFKKFHKK